MWGMLLHIFDNATHGIHVLRPVWYLSLPCPQVAYYCCKEHQTRHWKRHKPVCEHLKELAQKKAPPSWHSVKPLSAAAGRWGAAL